MFCADEPPHWEAPLEWWFFHGSYQGAEVEKCYFMATLFRFEVLEEQGPKRSAFIALISVLDAGASQPRTSVRVDRTFLEAKWQRGGVENVEAYLPKAALGELRKLGLPKGVEYPSSPPKMAAERLAFKWADLEMESSTDGVRLSFLEPGKKLAVELNCTVSAPRMEIDASRSVGEPEQAMHYVTYPRLLIEGTANGGAANGEGWFDHQWGGMAWLQSNESPPKFRGWDWLGFVLGDGSAWTATVHWDAKSREVFARHLTVRDDHGQVQVIHDFEWQPLRWWTSPATMVKHPVEWRLRVPSLDAALDFTPVTDNQEIFIFGPMRAIWEGAGRVQGTVRGQPMEGAARLEGQGRGYLFGVSAQLQEWSRQFVDVCKGFKASQTPSPDPRRSP